MPSILLASHDAELVRDLAAELEGDGHTAVIYSGGETPPIRVDVAVIDTRQPHSRVLHALDDTTPTVVLANGWTFTRGYRVYMPATSLQIRQAIGIQLAAGQEPRDVYAPMPSHSQVSVWLHDQCGQLIYSDANTRVATVAWPSGHVERLRFTAPDAA